MPEFFLIFGRTIKKLPELEHSLGLHKIRRFAGYKRKSYAALNEVLIKHRQQPFSTSYM